MSCLTPVDDCVDEGDDQQKSDQARHHQVGSWQTLAVATIVILISNIIIVINIKMLESLGSISRHLYDDKADDGEDEAEAVDDEEGVHELWPGGDGGTDKWAHIRLEDCLWLVSIGQHPPQTNCSGGKSNKTEQAREKTLAGLSIRLSLLYGECCGCGETPGRWVS